MVGGRANRAAVGERAEEAAPLTRRSVLRRQRSRSAADIAPKARSPIPLRVQVSRRPSVAGISSFVTLLHLGRRTGGARARVAAARLRGLVVARAAAIRPLAIHSPAWVIGGRRESRAPRPPAALIPAPEASSGSATLSRQERAGGPRRPYRSESTIPCRATATARSVGELTDHRACPPRPHRRPPRCTAAKAASKAAICSPRRSGTGLGPAAWLLSPSACRGHWHRALVTLRQGHANVRRRGDPVLVPANISCT